MANWGIKLKTITPQSGVKTSSVLLFRRSENKNKKTQGLNYSRAAHVKFASILFEIESESLKKNGSVTDFTTCALRDFYLNLS